MKDLIRALEILYKYMEIDSYHARRPTVCVHDCLYVHGIEHEVSDEDLKRLEELGFNKSDEFDQCFYSYRFGSC